MTVLSVTVLLITGGMFVYLVITICCSRHVINYSFKFGHLAVQWVSNFTVQSGA